MRRQLDQIVTQWVASEPPARVVVDADLSPLWTSDTAQALLNQPGSLLRHDGRLSGSTPHADEELRTLVAHAEGTTRAHCLPDPECGRHLVVMATRIEGPWAPRLGITIHNAGEDQQVAVPDLRQVFGFTRAEAAVARHLLCGRTAEEAAADLGVALETVRTHIKRAYAKMGVGSREAFFHKLAPFFLSLA